MGVCCLSVWCWTAGELDADVITTFGAPVLEDFNTLAATGTSSTLPSDWALSETGTSANTTYTANGGSSTTGETYSYGSGTSTERALGSLASASLQSTFGSKYTNSTGDTIVQLDISFDGEQWRAQNTNQQKLDFEYSLNATSLTTGTWVGVDALDILSVTNTNSSPFALDGNDAANRATYSATISNLSISNGADFWIRFRDSNDSGDDHGLAVDNFSVTAYPSPEPGTLLLMGVGMLGLAGLRFCRKHRDVASRAR